MKKLQLYQQTDVVNPGEHKTVLREEDQMILYKKDGLVRFSRDGKPLYGGCSKNDKCLVGRDAGAFLISLLHHFGIGADFVAERDDLVIYKLRQLVVS
jgi:hypothetical protein